MYGGPRHGRCPFAVGLVPGRRVADEAFGVAYLASLGGDTGTRLTKQNSIRDDNSN